MPTCRPECWIDVDASGVATVPVPRWRTIVPAQSNSERFAGLPVAGSEPPDVGVEEVRREVCPSPQAGDLGEEERDVARLGPPGRHE